MEVVMNLEEEVEEKMWKLYVSRTTSRMNP
jgi:hypothetical protein